MAISSGQMANLDTLDRKTIEVVFKYILHKKVSGVTSMFTVGSSERTKQEERDSKLAASALYKMEIPG